MPGAPSQLIEKLDVTAVAGQISCPILVLDDDDEEMFYPGQAQQLYGLLRAPNTYTTLTTAEGAQLHCSPMAPPRQAEIVLQRATGRRRRPTPPTGSRSEPATG